MTQKHLMRGVAMAASLSAATGGISLIFPASAMAATPATLSVGESPRIIEVIDNGKLQILPKTHLASAIQQASSQAALPDATSMNHLQLVLNPSLARQAALKAMIANQHNPHSKQFDKWLTPQQYGQAFGIVDNDITAVTSWLTSQGFTINNVYPNKTLIDFSGTAGQLKQAFHTREAIYTIDGARHLANDRDVSVPAALQQVISGVMGLNDFHAQSFVGKPKLIHWDSAQKKFVSTNSTPIRSTSEPHGISQAIAFPGSSRGLVPNDMATMYGIRTIRNNGITGKGVTIAVVEDGDMVPDDWTNFVSTFNLAKFGGTFQQINPAPVSGPTNCIDNNALSASVGNSQQEDDTETVLDAEYATAIAPGANIWVATCADDISYGTPPDYTPTAATSNFFGGVFVAASNLINGASRPDVISASYGFGEYFVDSASKKAIDLMWAQADVEGISVFVSTGDSATNASFNGSLINGSAGNTALDTNALATSPNVTAVGGTDLADVLDGTTSQYFASTPSVVGGSALSYVPEIPWNESCGNSAAAKALGFSGAPAFCEELITIDPYGTLFTSQGSSGGASRLDSKPAWQRLVFNAAKDQSRDIPDVALFGGSYGFHTAGVIVCTANYACSPDFTGPIEAVAGTSLSSPMFAGIQALMDQGLHARGLPLDQGNVAPTLYALAATEYGGTDGSSPASLAACNANNGASGTANCVFHNVTRGSISTQCVAADYNTPNCWFYADVLAGTKIGLATTDANPTTYSVSNKAYGAQPGWSFASGLGSVNATNLLIAWRAFANAPAAISR